ncbi:U3 small nucleolar ribonucleoprotein mpp10 [Vitis vinifera]|uniref:U3 small nucleolar ribonucleoprotein mpp10 n=1 Tax=Vitis vinifera TaxID=29760 RepID=A0A438EZA2_VITVI|nr:U3 small nucleolar ribonucleoprotein mpp10 [Vitis vinifera]
MDTVHRLKSTEPPLWLSPSSELSQMARAASQHLFASLKPFAPKSPFDRLLVDGFDAEQIWQQIDIQSQPIISSLRRQINRFEKNPEEISKIFGRKKVRRVEEKVREVEEKVPEEEIGGFSEEEDEDLEEFDEDSEEGEDEERESEEDEAEDNEDGGGGGIEDSDALKDGEDENEDEEEEEEEEEEDDELGAFDLDDGENEGMDELDDIKYEDFFGPKRKVSKKSKLTDGLEDSDRSDEQEDDQATDNKNKVLSTHEKERENVRAKIEEMERANLESKTWTMQGEVTAAKRPKNSALEVDLDFEHNVRPPPVITEEVTASLEDLIQKRILEGRFDDVQKAPRLPSKAPKEVKEMDENKSKKGLAEIYEEEFVQKTNLDSAPLSFSDEQRKEVLLLIGLSPGKHAVQELCLKLDALSHFHFTPKPVIDDMSIQTMYLLLQWKRLHLWQFQMQLCWLLKKSLKAKETLRRSRVNTGREEEEESKQEEEI